MDSLLPYACLAVDHGWGQNVQVKAKKVTHKLHPSMSLLFLPICLLWSTMNRCYDNMESIGFIQWKENKKWKNLPRTTWLFEDLSLQLSYFPSHKMVVSRGSYVIEYIEIHLHRGGHGYRSIELFFKWYFGNLDFNVRYCGII